jgi:glycogen operon protein
MRDLVTFEHKHNEANLEGNRDGTDDNRSSNFGIEGETNDEAITILRRRQMRNLMTTLLLSTGVPMLTAGDEFGRTQIGNNNAYCQDNEISWLNWDWEPWQQELHAFTTSLVQLRRDHPAFRQRYFFAGRPIHEGGPKDLAWISREGREITVDEWNSSDSRTLGMFIAGVNGGKSFLVLMHAGQEAQTFTLPGNPYGSSYHRVIDTEQDSAIPRTTELASSDVAMVPHSMLVFEVTD